jgi:hypothetical protein
MDPIERSPFIVSPQRAFATTIWLTAAAALLLVANFGSGCQSRGAAKADPTASARTAASAPPKATDATVLLFANMGEADDQDDGCGQIIQAVRSAAAKGVKTREVDTRNKDKKAEVSRQYKIAVSPAVLFLDPSEKETRRFEGESSDTVKALKLELDRLTKR